PIDPEKSAAALTHLIKKIRSGKRKKEQVLSALIRIANEKMAEAIRKISVQQGHDPREFTLLSFAGAGGQHACSLAGILGMRKVLAPYDAGLLSAYGIGHASVERFEEKLVLKSWRVFAGECEREADSLFQKACASISSEGHKIETSHTRK